VLLPGQRDQFLRDVAHELKRCRKLGASDRTGHAVAQVATAVATAVNGNGARAVLPRDSRTSRGPATPCGFLNSPRQSAVFPSTERPSSGRSRN
jgi:hypothetical protein